METRFREEEALTFDDVLLEPRYSEISPLQVDLKTHLTSEIPLEIPIISAAMDKVTESATAVGMARAGGAGVIHRNLSIEQQALEVEKVKKSESGIVRDPVTIKGEQTVEDALALMKKFNISGLPIINAQKQLEGLITNRDLRFEKNLSRKVGALMTLKEKLITANEQIQMEEAAGLMHQYRIEKLPIVDAQFRLIGLITTKDIEKNIAHPMANRDSKGRLRVGAAVGIGEESQKRISALHAAQVDFIVIDTAHGASKNVVEMVRWSKKNYPALPVIGGNVATADGTQRLYEAGADAVKVGMGCGSICTTRIVAGVGVPQLTAILECSKVAERFKRPLIADGGIKYSGDIVKALAAGAHVVMAGGMLSGTDEAPGDLVYYQARTYKGYRGMGSIEAMKEGSRDRYGQMGIPDDNLIPEGIEGMVPYRGPLGRVLNQINGGIRAGLGYLGCKNLEELRTQAKFLKISNQGLKESHVHDVFITKEAPNYRPSM